MIEAVEIVARRNQASDVTLLNRKKNSLNTIDGVNANLVSRVGAPTAAAAMRMVTGVTVEGGKYVYVRGLGDRYSKTTLNGAELPGLDPNRNTVQMDIFPSNLIDQIIVYKNFTPDLQGSFSGGLVDVITKDFPDRFVFNVSTSWGINTNATSNDDFLSYQTGDTDWRASDDGTRAIPSAITELPPGSLEQLTFTDRDVAFDIASKAFQTNMYPQLDPSGMNHNHQISLGNQFNLFGRPFGFIAGVSYRNTFNSYADAALGRYSNASDCPDPSSPSCTIAPFLNVFQEGNSATAGESIRRDSRDVLLGSLIKLSYKPRTNHKFGVNLMHNRSGSSSVLTFDGSRPIDNSDWVFQTRTLGYIQRALTAFQFDGDHVFGKLQADWIVSLSESQQDEPDLRFFSNHFTDRGPDNIVFGIDDAAYQEPTRYFRDLDENNNNAKLNFTIPLKVGGELDGKIKFGGAYTYKERTFTENIFTYRVGDAPEPYRGDPSSFFAESNLGITISPYDLRMYIVDESEEENQYSGEQTVLAAYAMTEFPLSARLKVITGVRFETTEMSTRSDEPAAGEGNLDLQDLLPALNLVFKMRDNINLRAGYSRTLARPTFREFVPFSAFDFVGDFRLTGNPNLNRTLIDNFDVRWEWFPSVSELVSVSAFYKNFTDPIEKVFILEAGGTAPELQYQNIESATAYGVELELRTDLGSLIGSTFNNFQFSTNASFIASQIDIPSRQLEIFRRSRPDMESTRPLFGQSPFAFNAELAYINREQGWVSSLNYNIFGERLSAVGGRNPDVFEQPRGLLNFSISKKLFNNFSLRFRARNLLDPEFKQSMEYEGQEYIYESYRVGRSFSLSLSYGIK